MAGNFRVTVVVEGPVHMDDDLPMLDEAVQTMFATLFPKRKVTLRIGARNEEHPNATMIFHDINVSR